MPIVLIKANFHISKSIYCENKLGLCLKVLRFVIWVYETRSSWATEAFIQLILQRELKTKDQGRWVTFFSHPSPRELHLTVRDGSGEITVWFVF